MDLERDPAVLKAKQRRRVAMAGATAIGVIVLSVAVSRLEPALPTVAAATVWSGTVRRGPFVREVRGTGTLVPEEIRWITATTSGRVERLVLQPGAPVEPGTVILELSNPDLAQHVEAARLDWETAVAQLGNQRAALASTRLAQESALLDARSDLDLAETDLALNQSLAEQGLVSAFLIQQKTAVAERAKNRVELLERQRAATDANQSLQLAPAEAAVNQRRAEFDRLSRQRSDLEVKATLAGLLQAVTVEVGQQVGAGTNLARVSNPKQLKAEIRVPETLARDIAVGQPAEVDTRTGRVNGLVTRVDPAAEGGTVGVDVSLEGPLPPGARPDLSVDGTIELDRLTDVLYVESPAFGQEHSTISLFRLQPDGTAVRTPVAIGRRSVQFVEVVDGLAEGDRVVLSDMSSYDAFDRVTVH
jgi:HlyD family secretion protein